jgi:hypothetical protein
VFTNDPENKQIRLELSGTVKEFATIKPPRVHLKGAAGDSIRQQVTIIPETPEPFRILKVQAMKGTEIRYELESTEVSGRRAYALTVENKRQEPGRYFDRLVLITDVSDHHPLSVIVTGNIFEKKGSS